MILPMSINCSVCNRKSKLPEDHQLWSSLDGVHVDIYPVTVSGKPDKKTLGFICSSCLRYANSMRNNIKAQVAGVQISNHAVERFLERYNGPPMSDQSARLSILKRFSQAKEIKVRPEYEESGCLKHGHGEVRYYLMQGLQFVVSTDDPPIIITIAPAKRFREGIDYLYV